MKMKAEIKGVIISTKINGFRNAWYASTCPKDVLTQLENFMMKMLIL